MGSLRFLLAGLLFCGAAFADEFAPLNPVQAGTVTISCTTSSAATAIPGINSAQPRPQLELQNPGTSAIFVESGISTITAAVASGYPILPGQSKVVTISPRSTHVACITAAVTVTLYVTPGFGN